MGSSIEVAVEPLAPQHLADAAAMFAVGYPERAHEFERWPSGDPAARWGAVVAAELVGYAGLWCVHGDRFRFDLVVAAGWRRCGVASRMLQHIIADPHATGAATLQARAADDNAPALAFLARHGFAETMRMHRAVLDVTRFQLPAGAADAERQLATAGIAIAPLRELERSDRQCWERLRDVHHATQDGWRDPDPRPSPLAPLTTDEVRSRFQRNDRELGYETAFVALAGDRYVGFTGSSGTGVHPAFRNRGIALALKVRQIAAAKALGVPAFHTSSGNPAMLRVFDKLGYVRTTTEIRLVRWL